MKIVVAKWYHFDQIARLRRLAWLAEIGSNDDLRPGDEALASFDQGMQVAGWLRNPNCVVLLALQENEGLGYLAISTGRTAPYRQEPTIYIDGWYVQPGERHRHVAGLLYRAGYRIAQVSSPKYLQCMVLDSNETMHKIMRRHGFGQSAVLYERPMTWVATTTT